MEYITGCQRQQSAHRSEPIYVCLLPLLLHLPSKSFMHFSRKKTYIDIHNCLQRNHLFSGIFVMYYSIQ